MYLLFKVLHLFGVIAFIGNVATGMYWHSHAWRTRDPKLLAHTMHGIIRSDRVLTTPGVLALLVGGVGASMVGGVPMLRTGWILWTIVLFVLAGGTFGMFIAPLQRQMLALASAPTYRLSLRYRPLITPYRAMIASNHVIASNLTTIDVILSSPPAALAARISSSQAAWGEAADCRMAAIS